MQSLHIEERQTYRIRYLVVPEFIFQNKKLTRLAADLYSFIHGYRAPEFFFSNEKLAEIFNCDERSITRAIAQLTEEGYITWEQPNGRKRYITDLWIDKVVYPGETELSTHLKADGETKLSTLNSPNDDELRRKNNEISIPNKNISNKNNLENFEDIKESEEFEEWRAAKKARKQRKASGSSRKLGNSKAFVNSSSYKEKKALGNGKRSAADGGDLV